MEKIIKKKGSSFGFIFYFIIKLYSNINKKKYINVIGKRNVYIGKLIICLSL
jgi:hypothetical protein